MIPEPIGAEGQPLDEQNKPLEHDPATLHANQDQRSTVVPEWAGLTGEASAESVATRESVAGKSASTACDHAPMGERPDQQELVHQEEDEQEDEEEAVVEEIEDVEPLEEVIVPPAGEEDIQKEWYILKVQSNREQSICDGLQRRVAIAGLERFFGDVIVPTEDVAEFKNGKRRVVKRKLYPGYIVVNMAINDETWFLVRETPGIGDFTGSAGRPTPMLPQEVERIVKSGKSQEEGGEPIKTAIPFKQGDRVRIKEGTFENFEGDVEGIDEANGRVTVMINIFGRSTPVELEHWQIDAV